MMKGLSKLKFNIRAHSMLIAIILPLFFAGCGKTPKPQKTGPTNSLGAEGILAVSFAPSVPPTSCDNLTASVTVISSTATNTIPLTKDCSERTVSATISDLSPGTYTLVIDYFLGDVKIVSGSTIINITAGENTPVTFPPGAMTFPDDDRDKVSNLDEVVNGTDPASPEIIVGLSFGGAHTCIIRLVDSARTLWCWGSDANGQLGNDALIEDQAIPIQVGTDTDWAILSAGSNHTCATKTDTTTLWCWGSDTSGQIGNGPVGTDQAIPVQEAGADTDWFLLSAGGSHTCAMKTDLTLFCWGSNGNGQLGDDLLIENKDSPDQVGLGTWSRISAGGNHTCAIDISQSLWCWGSDAKGQLGDGTIGPDEPNPGLVAIGTNFQSVSAGGSHTCAIDTFRFLWCWGSRAKGQVGDGLIGTNQPTPTKVGGETDEWLGVSAGDSHTCATKTDNTIWCWGSNAQGQIGNGTIGTNQETPKQVGDTGDWLGVLTGNSSSHTCAAKTDFTFWCWGAGDAGQLGTGSTLDSPDPT